MQSKTQRFGPVALTNAAANLLNPPTTTGGTGTGTPNTYLLVKHICIVNKTGVSHSFSLFVGATGGSAAGTEVVGSNTIIPANTKFDHYFGGEGMRLDVADFLTGLAHANAALTIQGEYEIAIA